MRKFLAFAIATIAACSGDDGSSGPRTVSIWRNGNAGCWGDPSDDCDSPNGNRGRIVGSMSNAAFGVVATPDDVTGGTPSMSVLAMNGSGFFAFCIGSMSFNMCEQRDLSEFAGGHLELDIRLESTIVTKLAIELFPPLSVEIPLAELNATSFVHRSIPLAPDLFGTDGPMTATTVFKLVVTSDPTTTPIALINDITWTTD